MAAAAVILKMNLKLLLWTERPAKPGYTLPLQRLKRPTDLDLHCLPFSMWIYINNLAQAIWLAENWKWTWHFLYSAWQRLKNIGRVKRKKCIRACARCAEDIILSMLKVSSGPLLSIDSFYSVKWCKQRTAKALIRLRICAVWSGPSLSAYARRHVFA